MIAFCPEHPKWDQNPKFTPLSETTSIPPLFIWEPFPPPPPPPGTALPYHDVAPKRQFVDVPNLSCWPWELLSSALTALHLSNSCWTLSESLASHSFHARSDLHGSVIFIHSAPTRASFDTRDNLPRHLVCHAFLSITLAFRSYRVFSCDVSGNRALLSVNVFFCFGGKTRLLITWVKTGILYPMGPYILLL